MYVILYTIKEAASILNVSESTIRRKIKNNELTAEKKEGPYGSTYYIPTEVIDSKTAQHIVEVIKTNKPIDIDKLQKVILEELEIRNKQLIDNIEEKAREREKKLFEAIEKQTEELKSEINKAYKINEIIFKLT
ncbi:MAG: helix-turn-helix domain-containing protein [archaeon]